jgi:hypothetical protein
MLKPIHKFIAMLAVSAVALLSQVVPAQAAVSFTTTAAFTYTSTGLGAAPQVNKSGTDSSGNIYIAGVFGGASGGTINDGANTLTAAGGADVFISKFNSSRVLQWTKSFGSAANELLRGFAVTPTGDVIVSGQYCGAMTLAGTTPISVPFVSVCDGYVIKYDTTGAPVWAKTFGGSSTTGATVNVNYMRIDSAGDIYTSTQFTKIKTSAAVAASIPGQTINASSFASDGAGIVVSKLNSSGTSQWSKLLPEGSGGGNLNADKLGELLVTSSFTLTSTYDSFGPFTPSGTSDGVVLGIPTAGGNFDMAKVITGTGNDTIKEVAWGPGNTLYVYALASGAVTFNGSTLTTTSSPTGIGQDSWFIKANLTSNTNDWATVVPNTNTGGTGILSANPGGLRVDTSGNMYLNAYISNGAMTFGTFGSVTAGKSVLFSINSSGSIETLKQFTALSGNVFAASASGFLGNKVYVGMGVPLNTTSDLGDGVTITTPSASMSQEAAWAEIAIAGGAATYVPNGSSTPTPTASASSAPAPTPTIKALTDDQIAVRQATNDIIDSLNATGVVNSASGSLTFASKDFSALNAIQVQTADGTKSTIKFDKTTAGKLTISLTGLKAGTYDLILDSKETLVTMQGALVIADPVTLDVKAGTTDPREAKHYFNSFASITSATCTIQVAKTATKNQVLAANKLAATACAVANETNNAITPVVNVVKVKKPTQGLSIVATGLKR